METPTPGGAAPQEKYSLPVVALVLSLLGACTCITSPVGAVLGIISMVRIHREPRLGGMAPAIAAITIAVGLVPFQLGVISAIAIPNVIRSQARAKQGECRAALRSLWTKQVAFRAQTGKWATRFAELDFEAPPGNRYAYLLSEREVLPVAGKYRPPDGGATHVDELKRLGIPVGSGADHFTAACVANIDNDPTLDVWILSSNDRPDAPAGTPVNVVNDVVY